MKNFYVKKVNKVYAHNFNLMYESINDYKAILKSFQKHLMT
jgi:hypothetical protein